MGVSFNGHAGAIDWIQSRFKKGRPATLYFDEVRTPAYTDCLNRLYERVLASDLRGLYHAGGPRALSLYQIAQIVNRVGGYDPEAAHGLPADRSRPDPAARRRRDDEFRRPGRSARRRRRSTPGRTIRVARPDAPRLAPRAQRRHPVRASCWPACCTAIRGDSIRHAIRID